MRIALLIFFLCALSCLAQLASTEITDKVQPKYPAEATAWSVDLFVEKEVTKVEQALAELKADKQVVGKNPRTVYAIEIEGLNDKGVSQIVIVSGSFATKDDALAWLVTFGKKCATTPDLLPKEPRYYLHTCRHRPEGDNEACTREEIKP